MELQRQHKYLGCIESIPKHSVPGALGIQGRVMENRVRKGCGNGTAGSLMFPGSSYFHKVQEVSGLELWLSR